MNRPTVPPARKATCIASFIEPVWAAAAVRTLARVESHIPRKPMKPEATAPTRKATVRAVPDWANERSPLMSRPGTTSASMAWEVTNTTIASGITIMPMVRN